MSTAEQKDELAEMAERLIQARADLELAAIEMGEAERKFDQRIKDHGKAIKALETVSNEVRAQLDEMGLPHA